MCSVLIRAYTSFGTPPCCEKVSGKVDRVVRNGGQGFHTGLQEVAEASGRFWNTTVLLAWSPNMSCALSLSWPLL